MLQCYEQFSARISHDQKDWNIFKAGIPIKVFGVIYVYSLAFVKSFL